MKGNMRNIVILLMIFSIMIFIFSGCDILSEYYFPHKGGNEVSNEDNSTDESDNEDSSTTHVIKNWDFNDSETYDAIVEYQIASGDKMMINGYSNTNEDIIPGWMDFEDLDLNPSKGIRIMDSNNNSTFKIDIGNTDIDSDANNEFLILNENRNVVDSNTIEIKMAQKNLNYDVKSNSFFKIRVKFKSADDGGATYPFLFVNASINGTSYNLFAASPDNAAKWPENNNVVDTGIDHWTEFSVNLEGLDVVNPAGVWDYSYSASHYTIKTGDTIESITVSLAFHSAEAYIDYIDIYEE